MKTRRELVLELLQSQAGEWIDAHMICHPGVGGSEGLRRLRELRAEGHLIEMRKKPGGSATRQYRMLLGDLRPGGLQLKFNLRREEEA